MTDLLDFVALSLLPPWCWRVAAERLRGGDPPAHRRRGGCSRRAPHATNRQPRRRSVAAPRTRSAARGAGVDRGDSRGAIRRIPPALTTIVDPPPVLWTRGRLDGAERARRRDRRIARRVAVRARRRRAARRPISRRAAWSIVSGLARGVDSAAHRGALAGRRRDGRGARLRRRRHLSAGARAARARRSTQTGAVVSELVPGTRAAADGSFRCATGSSAGCRARSSSSRRARRAAR